MMRLTHPANGGKLNEMVCPRLIELQVSGFQGSAEKPSATGFNFETLNP
jgi:hypothetical protein